MSDSKRWHHGRWLAPLLFGLWFLSDVLLRPRVAQYRTVDIVQIVASSAVVGMGLGIAIMVRKQRRTAASVVDIQQAVDGILADKTPASAESSAPSTSAVTIDRTRLLQLRERFDALLAALNRP
jgi:hypothetical protein